ncbi:MAG: SIS domain-containing protein [Traorella sp.]
MSLLDCIKRIPNCLNHILDTYPQLNESIRNYINYKKIDEIVFIASGSSMNASKVTRYFAENICKLNFRYFYPNEFVNYFNYINKNALYIVVSQGGSTKLVYEALEKIQKYQCLNCSITEKLDSPIAQKADLAIEMGSDHEEYMYRTIGYSTTAITCSLIEMCLGEINQKLSNTNEIMEDLRKAISNLDVIREKTTSWYYQHKFSLMRRSKVILAGAQCFYETANEADIKLMEMVPLFTRSFELEELIHGPQNAFDDATIYFLLSNHQKDDEKVRKIAQFLKNEIGFCAIVGNQKLDENDLYFDLQSNYFTYLEEITAFQTIAYYMAIDHGRDLSRGVNTTINNYIKKTL